MRQHKRFVAGALALACLIIPFARDIIPPNTIPSRIFSLTFLHSVDEIVIQGPREGFPLVFRRVEGTWVVVFDSDHLFPANVDRIEGLLDSLGKRHRIRRLADTNAFSQGTSGEGSCSITLTSRGIAKTISFGLENADGRLRYARREGDSVIIAIEGNFSPWLDNATQLWLDKYPFARAFSASLSRAAIFGDGFFFTLEDDASLERVTRLLAGLTVVDLTNIPATPSIRMRLEHGDASVSTLSISLLDGQKGIITDDTRKLSWIVDASEIQEVVLTFQHFSAM